METSDHTIQFTPAVELERVLLPFTAVTRSSVLYRDDENERTKVETLTAGIDSYVLKSETVATWCYMTWQVNQSTTLVRVL